MSQESRTGVIEAASRSPLALFALIVVVAEVGLGVTVKLVEGNKTAVLVLIVGIILLLLTMVFLVGAKVLGKKTVGAPGLNHISALGERAVRGYLEGGNAKNLDGRWRAEWFQYDEQRKPQAYTVKDQHTGEEVPYPADIISLKTSEATISAEAHDQTTKRVYYLEGRISTRDIVTLQYWSQAGTNEASLVGVLIMQLKRAYEGFEIEGTWSGFTAKDKVVHGTVKWTKLTIN